MNSIASNIISAFNSKNNTEKLRIISNFNYNVIPLESLNEGLDKKWFGDYVPTQNSINLNLERLEFSRARSLLKRIEKKKKNGL